MLSNSEIYNRGCNGDLFDPNIKETILGIDIAPVILGDPAYPLLDWLIKAYPENQNTPNWQRHFNYRLSRARMTVEDTFGRWKGRFRRVLKRVDMAVDSTCYLVVASCILHNICELKRDAFLEEWLEDIQIYRMHTSSHWKLSKDRLKQMPPTFEMPLHYSLGHQRADILEGVVNNFTVTKHFHIHYS